ncbi:MAG: RecQ family ATP-dependent DNA helicase, partial [Saprospiraceae bacterium]|nr:RecQ family ATP-dependent DNA helicase [Saprospiraceae bacterium]
ERSQLQEAWIDGKVRVMVSTNAFGMGIDKPDVRSVVHLDLPDSLEAYYQEAGRAGRDGRKAYATLLYDASDRLRLETQYDQSFPDVKEIRRIYQALGSYYQLAIGSGEGQSFDFDLLEFSRTFKLEPIKAFSALKVLEQAGWVVLTEAVHVPSSFQILVDKDTLYDYQLKNRQFDKVLKALLR